MIMMDILLPHKKGKCENKKSKKNKPITNRFEILDIREQNGDK